MTSTADESAPPPIPSLDALPLDVEVDASPRQLAAMVRHIAANWRLMGEVQPHFSVIVDPAYYADRIAESEEQFYQSGEHYVADLRRTTARAGIDIAGYRRCLELGCGVGRLSVWLAAQFETVIAVDISPPHLAIARRAAERFGRSNIEFVHLESPASLGSIGAFDIFTSVIVLQHNPPPLIAMILRSVLGQLRPGGVAFFQVPVYREGYSFHVAEYLAAAPGIDGMEMHLIPQAALFRLLRETGCELLACLEDGATGGYMVSNTILARKAAAGDIPKTGKPRSAWRWWR
jgi:SAM-dependent methyltransferase